MADKVEILLRARGGRQVASESSTAARGIGKIERSAALAHRASGKLAGGLRGLGHAALWTGGAVAAGLVVEVKRGTAAWEQHRKIAADTARVIKTTGGTANVSAKHVDRLSNQIQNMAAVDDDAVSAGQNMLLTFLRVRNEAGKGNKVFDRATKLAVDMSARFGGDAKRSFIQLGKALDDPIKGITALRRTGVTFTKSELKKIKTLEDTGHHLEAQKMILAALDKQVGGSARAQATPIERLKQSWGDLEKELGHQLAPTIDKVTTKINALVLGATDLFSRKDLSFGMKVRLFAQRDLEPEAKSLVAGLKRAHLDRKLEGAVEWAIPKIADGFATAAPRAASAFIRGFQGAGTWGKLITVAFLAKKLGAFGALGRLIAGGIGRGGLGGAVGSMKPVPVYVVNEGGGSSLTKWAEKWGSRAAVARYAGAGLTTAALAADVGLVKLATDAYMAGGKTDYQRKKRLGLAEQQALKNPLGSPGVGTDRSGRPRTIVIGGHTVGVIDPRLAGYPDSHPVSRSTRLDRYPDSHALDRLPDKVAGAVARRPLALSVTAQPINLFVDGVKVANATAQVELKYKDRG